MGWAVNIVKFPCDIKSERLRFTSNIGPGTKARINGAGSYSNFLKR